MEYDLIFKRLWKLYTEQNPSVQRVYDLFTDAGETVINDHIAFRTFRNPLIGVDVLAEPFLKNGYVEKGSYRFEEKKLLAKHYEHATNPDAPRVFISELLLEEFSDFLQETIKKWIRAVPECLLGSENILFAGNASEIPSFPVYEKLREESEYAAWLYVNGFRANHFTVSVNHLKQFNTLEKVNAFLKENGFRLNDGAGEIQGTPDQLLQQSSIKAEKIPVKFVEGTFEIPGCYYEFALRYPDANGELFSGFIAKSADKIFESTDGEKAD